MRAVNLFVIERRTDDALLYWSNSPEHGCGWNPHQPKQAWSKSEVIAELRLMIERGYFTDFMVRRVWLPTDMPIRVENVPAEPGN